MRDWFFCAMGYVWYCVYLCIVSSPKSRLGMIKQPSVSVSLVITGSNGGPCAYFQGKGFHEVVYFAQNGEKKPLFWGRNASRPMPQILGSWCWRSQTRIPCTMRHTIHAQLKYPSSRFEKERSQWSRNLVWSLEDRILFSFSDLNAFYSACLRPFCKCCHSCKTKGCQSTFATLVMACPGTQFLLSGAI